MLANLPGRVLPAKPRATDGIRGEGSAAVRAWVVDAGSLLDVTSLADPEARRGVGRQLVRVSE